MSPRRPSFKTSYTPAGPVTTIAPDGTVTVTDALAPTEYRRLIEETEPRGGWMPVAKPAHRRTPQPDDEDGDE